jgi:hypothetical protein
MSMPEIQPSRKQLHLSGVRDTLETRVLQSASGKPTLARVDRAHDSNVFREGKLIGIRLLTHDYPLRPANQFVMRQRRFLQPRIAAMHMREFVHRTVRLCDGL